MRRVPMRLRKLQFDPTPAGLIARPLSKTYRSVWTSVRNSALKQHGPICQVCGHIAEERRHIHCHEVYAFPNQDTVLLERVVLLCWLCHDAVHFERTSRRCGKKYVDEVTAHYRAINGGLSAREFEGDVKTTFNRMLEIRKFYGGPAAQPKIDYGPHQARVDRYLATRSDDGDSDEEYFLYQWPYMSPSDDTSLGWWMFA